MREICGGGVKYRLEGGDRGFGVREWKSEMYGMASVYWR